MTDYFEKSLRENNVWHRFAEGRTKSAKEAAETTGIGISSIVKTLIFEADSSIVAVIAPAACRVSTKKLKALFNSRDAKLASPEKVLEITGYEAGAVPPFFHKSRLRTIADKKILPMEKAWAGGGTTTRLVELKISDIIRFSSAEIADIVA